MANKKENFPVVFEIEKDGRWYKIEFDLKDGTQARQAFAQTAAHLQNSIIAQNYLTKRGLTVGTAAGLGKNPDTLGWGYADKVYFFENGQKFEYAAIIMPFWNGKQWAFQTRNFYRDTLKSAPDGHRWGGRGGKITYLKNQLFTGKPCFICEGFFDAAAFIECGYNAVALMGVDGQNAFLNLIKENPPQSPIILAFDNDFKSDDNTGRDEENNLRAALKEFDFFNVKVLKESYFHGQPDKILNYFIGENIKDAADFLQKNRLGFIEYADNLIKKALSGGDVFDEKINNFPTNSERAGDFKTLIAKNKSEGVFPTGFCLLDSILGGGLKRRQLYSIGALPSLGKTALALQIADNAAMAGKQILFFSFEIPTEDLMARSISRLSFEFADDSTNTKFDSTNTKTGFSTDAVLFGELPEPFLDKLITVADKAFWQNQVAFNGAFQGFTVNIIRATIENYLKQKGETPLVIVDYFQIVQSDENFYTDKQKADAVICDLKKCAIDFDVPILAISSLNRQNYSEEITFAAFKESGAIEYTADVLIGLQVGENITEIGGAGAGDFEEPKKEKTDAQKRAERKEWGENYQERVSYGGAGLVELKILKNRNGKKGSVNLFFSPLRNTFYEKDPAIQIFKNDA